MIRREEIIGDCRLILGDCLEVLPQLGPVDAVVTDPPYGANKAAWDTEFPIEWYSLIRAERVVVITGSQGLTDAIRLVGSEFIDVIAARNMNGMTRGPLGFGNWLAAVIAKGKPRQGTNAFDFAVYGEMPDHPSPKPLIYMLKLIGRVTEPGETILDPFMGSGTTGIACVRLGRRFIGIEIDEGYFDIACERIRRAYAQPDLFIEPPSQAPSVQLALI